MILVWPQKKKKLPFLNGLQIFSNDDHFNVLFYMCGHHGLHQTKGPWSKKIEGSLEFVVKPHLKGFKQSKTQLGFFFFLKILVTILNRYSMTSITIFKKYKCNWALQKSLWMCIHELYTFHKAHWLLVV